MSRFVALLATVTMLLGCTENSRARSFGGSFKQELPECQKLVNVTWKDQEMWILTRDFSASDVPQTYSFKEKSQFGLVEGTVTFVEHCTSAKK